MLVLLGLCLLLLVLNCCIMSYFHPSTFNSICPFAITIGVFLFSMTMTILSLGLVTFSLSVAMSLGNSFAFESCVKSERYQIESTTFGLYFSMVLRKGFSEKSCRMLILRLILSLPKFSICIGLTSV